MRSLSSYIALLFIFMKSVDLNSQRIWFMDDRKNRDGYANAARDQYGINEAYEVIWQVTPLREIYL